MSNRAIARARAMSQANTPIPEGTCVLQVRTVMDIPNATGDQDGDGDADATDAWIRTVRKVPVSGPAFRLRRGAWVYFRDPRDVTRHGHAAIATGYGRGLDSTIWSPGTPKEPTRWRKVPLRAIVAGWGLEPVGYGLDLNDRPCPDLGRPVE